MEGSGGELDELDVGWVSEGETGLEEAQVEDCTLFVKLINAYKKEATHIILSRFHTSSRRIDH